jgi:hypothetical protein
MTTDPITDHIIIDTTVGRIDRFKKALAKHKAEIALGAALAVSLAFNYLQALQPEGTTKYFLTPEDVDYLNGLLEEDQKEQ